MVERKGGSFKKKVEWTHCTCPTPHFTLHTPYFTLHTPHSTLSTPHSALYTLHSALHILHFTLYIFHSSLHTLHVTLLTPHFTLYTPHSTLYTPHSTLYTFYTTLQTGNRGNMYKTVQINYCRKVFCVTAYPCVSTSGHLYHEHTCEHSGSWAASCFKRRDSAMMIFLDATACQHKQNSKNTYILLSNTSQNQ